MDFKRTLKRYMRGDDVWEVKSKLLELGYLQKATHNMYGNDTYKGVRNYQADNDLDIDGIVGYETWGKLIGHDPAPIYPIPDHITEPLRSVLNEALASVSEERREICLCALNYATQYDNADYPRGFYIRGANLYDTDLSLHLMTEQRLEKYFRKESYKPYYDNGRKEMMEKYAAEYGYNIPGADCSGFIVGLWRARKVTGPKFDATANALYQNYCIDTKTPMPGDLCWKNGHIGLYVGAGYAVEAAGGAYGIQITPCDKRKMYNFVTGRIDTQKGWTAYGDPKYY